MRLNYHTGIATLVQFVVMSLLFIINGIQAVTNGCTKQGGNCIDAVFVSVVFFILAALWFGSIWILGFFAQDRRSQKLAYLLIAVELAVIAVASFNARNETDTLRQATSLIDIALASWVILLAYKLSRSKGGRIMAGGRKRRGRQTEQL